MSRPCAAIGGECEAQRIGTILADNIERIDDVPFDFDILGAPRAPVRG